MSTTASRSLNIIIVGGGISGLAAAAWLREEHNVTVKTIKAISVFHLTHALIRSSRNIPWISERTLPTIME